MYIYKVQLIGIPAVAKLLNDLLTTCKQSINISIDTPLESVGACMSGFLEAGPQNELIALFNKEYPLLSKYYYIDNDSPGSIYTANGDQGGLVVIAGTGSMGQIIYSDGSYNNCGGHGHLYGDGKYLYLMCVYIYISMYNIFITAKNNCIIHSIYIYICIMLIIILTYLYLSVTYYIIYYTYVQREVPIILHQLLYVIFFIIWMVIVKLMLV